MDFASQAIAGAVLVALTLSIQCAGMAGIIHLGLNFLARAPGRLRVLHPAVFIVRVTFLLIGLHILEILLWAAFYRWMCLPSWGPAFYFSMASYSTVGYGDLVLPATWRSLGPLEAVTGVLMSGLSVSLVFAIVTRLVERVALARPDRSSRSTVSIAAR